MTFVVTVIELGKTTIHSTGPVSLQDEISAIIFFTDTENNWDSVKRFGFSVATQNTLLENRHISTM
jgi:hypothetical protein